MSKNEILKLNRSDKTFLDLERNFPKWEKIVLDCQKKLFNISKKLSPNEAEAITENCGLIYSPSKEEEGKLNSLDKLFNY